MSIDKWIQHHKGDEPLFGLDRSKGINRSVSTEAGMMTEAEERMLVRAFDEAWPDKAEVDEPRLSYHQILDWCGSVWFSADEGSYQGDLYVVLTKQRMVGGDWRQQWGLAVIGYGSCSGCDALEGARRDGRVETLQLVKDIANNIRWFDKLINVADYVATVEPRWWTDTIEAKQVEAVVRAFCDVQTRRERTYV